MIKKLRLKFIIFNMAIVTVLLIGILGLIYYFSQNNLEQKSVDMMRTISLTPVSGVLPEQPDEEVRLPYFTVQVGIDGELTAVGGGYYDLTNTKFLQELVDKVFEDQKEFGVIKEYNLRYLKVSNPFNPGVIFADTSSEQATLANLLRTCLIVGAVAFLAFLGLSILLSKLAVSPIEQAWKMQSQFVADASHELKTPLTVITTNAELLEGEVTPSGSRYVSNIETMSGRMKTLVGQMLDLARADNMNGKLHMDNVALSKAVDDVIMPFEPVFFEAGKNLSFNIEPGINVMGDEEKLKQVVQIFCDNAVKYSKEGAAVNISLSRVRNGHCLLCVSNEGDEIPKEELENIFRRFYRADKVRNDGNSYGLGLAMAKSIVEAYGGKIWAESSLGVNSFKAEFPCNKHTA